MTKTLRLAPHLSLPLDAITQRFGYLGRIGSGKSYASTKVAELMLDAGAQVVAIDPVGIWYGLRVDGKGKGFPIPVFGGLHGDVPLEATSGAMIADLVVDRALSCIIDVSQFESDAAKARFASAFAERFFFRKKAAPSAVHLFLEECQEFVPEKPNRDENMMLHHFTRMAKLGRNFGIGLSLISQRPQEVNKKVLNLTECLFAFQMTGVHERRAIRDWVSAKGADTSIVDILPTLAVGVAHVYSPQWLLVSQQVKVYEKRSSDVSSTPKFGAGVVESKPLTKVDLDALRVTMAATIEKAKADDPKELRKRIAELERDVAKKPSGNVGDVSHATMVSQINAAVAAARREEADFYLKLLKAIELGLTDLRQIADRASAAADRVSTAIHANGEQRLGQMGIEVPAVLARQPVAPSPRAVRAAPAEGVSKGQQKILNALAELDALGFGQTNRVQLGMFAGYNLTGGSGAQHIADLVAAGYVEMPDKGLVRLTAAGQKVADGGDTPANRRELHQRVFAKISDGQQRILQHLIDIYPDAISRADLGKQVGYNLTGGSGAQHVADLINAGAVRIPTSGKVVASDFLFPTGLRA